MTTEDIASDVNPRLTFFGQVPIQYVEIFAPAIGPTCCKGPFERIAS